MIEGVHYPTAKGYFTCCKPMQRKRYEGLFSCYIFAIETQDPQLTKALNALPAYGFHPEEDVDLQKLADDSHLHPTYFHKLFTAAFGRTPAEYLMWYRVLLTREYLRDDNCSISEVAAKCGFSSPSYFSQKFRLYSSCSPSKYRKAIRKRRKQ